MSAYSKPPWSWTAGTAEMLHMKLDDFLVLATSLDCPITDSQRIELGRLHELIFNVHGELAHEGIQCDYSSWLKDSPMGGAFPRSNSMG